MEILASILEAIRGRAAGLAEKFRPHSVEPTESTGKNDSESGSRLRSLEVKLAEREIATRKAVENLVKSVLTVAVALDGLGTHLINLASEELEELVEGALGVPDAEP